MTGPITAEIRWVGQKHTYGCMAAVAAMIIGTDYEGGVSLLTDSPESLNSSCHGYFALESRLVDRGYAVARKYAVTQSGNRKRDQWPCEPWAAVHWCEVMTSESASKAHAVVMLGDGIVLDPGSPEPRRLSDYAKVNFIAAVVPVVLAARTPDAATVERLRAALERIEDIRSGLAGERDALNSARQIARAALSSATSARGE